MRKDSFQLRPGQLLTAVLCVVMILLPVYQDIQQPLDLAFIHSIALFAIAGIFLLCGFQAALQLPRGLLAFTAVLFFGWNIVAAVVSIYPVDAWLQVYQLFFFGVLFVAAANLGRIYPRYRISIQAALLIAASIQVLIGFHQLLFSGWYMENMTGFWQNVILANRRGDVLRAVGLFGNANYFAAFVNIALAVALAKALDSETRRNWRIAYAALSLFFLSGVVVSGSKMALAVSGLIFFIILLRKHWLLAVGLFIAGLALVVFPTPVQDTFVRGVTGDQTFGMRPPIWASSLSMTLDNPFTGTGPGGYQFLSHLYAPANTEEIAHYARFPRIAHNTFLHVTAETGLVGGLAFLGLMMVLLIRSLQNLLLKGPFSGSAAVRIGVSAALTGTIVHSLVDNTLDHFSIGFALAVLLPLSHYGQENSWYNVGHWVYKKAQTWGRPVLVGVTLLLTAVLATGFIYKPAYYEEKMQGLNARISSTLSLANDEKNSKLAKTLLIGARDELKQLQHYYDNYLALNRNLGLVHASLFRMHGNFDDFFLAQHHYRKANTLLKGKSRIDVYNELQVYLDLVAMNYRPTNELVMLLRNSASRAISNWPNRAYLYVVAASIEMQLQDVTRARSYIDECLQLEPNYLQAYVYGDRLGILTGNDDYRKQMQSGFAAALDRIDKLGPPELGDDYGWVMVTVDRVFQGQEWLLVYEQRLRSFAQKVQRY